MKHKLPLSYVWNTYIYPIAIMVGAIVFGVYFGMVEGNKREQILAYAMESGGHLERYVSGEYMNTNTDGNGNVTHAMPQQIWSTGIRYKDGTLLTSEELEMRHIVRPFDFEWRKKKCSK